MLIKDFYQAIDSDSSLKGLGIDGVNRCIKIFNNVDNTIRVISFDQIRDNDWSVIKRILTGEIDEAFGEIK